MKTFLKFMCIAIITVGFVSCSDDDTSGTNSDETARVSIELTDAPGDYDAVFIDVEDVVIKYNGDDDEVFIDDVDVTPILNPSRMEYVQFSYFIELN